jgi:hypothetical protein
MKDTIVSCVTTVRKKLLPISFSVALLMLIDGSPWVLFGGKSKRSLEDLASQNCFWAPFLHGDLFDWCLVYLEAEK